MIRYTTYASPLGSLLLAATDQGLAGLYFAQHRHFKGPQDWQRDESQPTLQPILQQTAAQLTAYFAGQRRDFDLPLDLQGTPFQRAVWDALRRIPFGSSVTYAEHAQSIGNPRAVRAVGTAIGRNPISIIVPCHRVLGAQKALTGYAGGLERKQALLTLEGIALS